MLLKYFTDEVIDSATDNSSGTLLTREAIDVIVEAIIKTRNLNKTYVDKLIDENSCDFGYMVKFGDFNYALNDFIVGDRLQQDLEPEKPEKNLTNIEILYGDWHSECGDR